MTARAAVFELLTSDPGLNSYGINTDTVWPNHAVDSPPRDTYFMVLRWETAIRRSGMRGINNLSVWVHRAKNNGVDLVELSDILRLASSILENTIHRQGADGYILTQARWLGEGSDAYDGGYDTITRNASFEINSRKAT